MSATPADLSALIDAAAGRPILVVGDLMLDHFVVGRVDRISPEAPVPVVCFEEEEYRLGGAANVAHNVAALGGSVELLGVVGDDEPAAHLRTGLGAAGVRHDALVTDPSRCTTRKLRVVTTRNQQVARIDYESDREITGGLQDALAAAVHDRAAHAAVVVISDYQKGTITRAVAQSAIAAARAARVPVLIDPKVPHVDYYSGASLVTPNHHEAEAVTLLRIRSPEEAQQAAIRFRERVGCDSVLITRGEHGMWLLAPEGEFDLRAEAREVSDVTGAGDTVIAAMAIGLAGGGSLQQSARLANRAAGVAVSRFGPTAVSAVELRDALQAD
jgi:D-glycero-beta-D-manno-heptose-7-phosphate kinase